MHTLDARRLRRSTEELWVTWLGDKRASKQKYKKLLHTMRVVQALNQDDMGVLPLRLGIILEIYLSEYDRHKDDS